MACVQNLSQPIEHSVFLPPDSKQEIDESLHYYISPTLTTNASEASLDIDFRAAILNRDHPIEPWMQDNGVNLRVRNATLP